MSFPTILRRSLPTWLVWAVPLAAAAPAPWQSHAPLPEPRTEVAAGVARGEIVVVGGFTADGGNSARVGRLLDRAQRLAPAARPAGRGRPCRRRRAQAGTSTSSAATAAIGTRSRRRSCSGKDETWQRLPALPDARAAAAAAIAGGKLYVLGGVDGRRGLARVAFALDLKSAPLGTDPRARRRASISRPPRPERASTPSAAAAQGSTRTRARFEVYDAEDAPLDAAGPDPAGARRHRRRRTRTAGSSRSAASGRRGRSPRSTPTSCERSAGAGSPTFPRRATGSASSRTPGRVYAVAGGPQPGLTVSGAVESLRP